MPHIRLEMSDGVPRLVSVPELLRALVDCLSECETVAASAVKACADVHQFHAVGVGHPPEFVRLTISILAGRSSEIRGAMADAMFAVLRSAVPPEIGVSQEIREMSAADYRK